MFAGGYINYLLPDEYMFGCEDADAWDKYNEDFDYLLKLEINNTIVSEPYATIETFQGKHMALIPYEEIPVHTIRTNKKSIC